MKDRLRLFCLLSMLALIATVRAQSETHWDCNPSDYHYDMTVYLSLSRNGNALQNLNNFEVAAFVGEECRGIAEVQTLSNDTQYLYLRVRSNTTSGESITFKVYDKKAEEEVEISADDLTFESDAVRGLPSNPLVITLEGVLLGDVNGDGQINVGDISAVTNYILGRPNTVFIYQAADMNSDGQINVGDISAITNIILGK